MLWTVRECWLGQWKQPAMRVRIFVTLTAAINHFRYWWYWWLMWNTTVNRVLHPNQPLLALCMSCRNDTWCPFSQNYIKKKTSANWPSRAALSVNLLIQQCLKKQLVSYVSVKIFYFTANIIIINDGELTRITLKTAKFQVKSYLDLPTSLSVWSLPTLRFSISSLCDKGWEDKAGFHFRFQEIPLKVSHSFATGLKQGRKEQVVARQWLTHSHSWLINSCTCSR